MEKPYDVGLVDIVLPDIAENELAYRIQARPPTAAMKKIAIIG